MSGALAPALAAWRDAGTTHDFVVGGRSHAIHVQQRGGGQAALLLVHGFPTASYDWHRVIDAFARRFRVIAPDLLGFGFSDKPRGVRYTVELQADLVESLLAARGAARVHVVAHDLGDTVTQELLARVVERRARGADGLQIASIVFLNGGLFPEAHRPRVIQRALASPIGPLLARFLGERRFARSFAAVFGPQTQPDDDALAAAWQLVAHDDGQRLAPAQLSYLAGRRARRARWVGALCGAPCPVRLVAGLADPVSGRTLVERYCELVPGPDIVELEGIGHYPQLEAPEAVIEACVSFWQRIGAGERGSRSPEGAGSRLSPG